jgi:arylsulfatase A-like enzyme
MTPLYRFWLLTLLLMAPTAIAQGPARNMILITVDGLRWQEVFRGMDERLLKHERFTKHPDVLRKAFSAEDPQQARAKLLPFIWGQMSTQGVLLGNRDQGSHMQVSNDWHFSYPGYNEILTGVADPTIDSNKPIPNANINFLEWVNQQKGFRGKVQAFGSWDVFPAILNSKRAGFPINAGFSPAEGKVSKREALINQMQQQTPSPWQNVRLDVFTHQYAMSALEEDKPRVIYIAYGETDDFAHDGQFDQYIQAAHRFDNFVRELWVQVQKDRRYRDKTVLLITTDHGRGELPLEGWQHHGSKKAVAGYVSLPAMARFREGVKGSDQVWLAAMGPGVKPRGEIAGEWFSNQIAATALQLLGFEPSQFSRAAGQPISEIVSIQSIHTTQSINTNKRKD